MDFKSLRIAFALLMPLLWADGVWATPCADTDYDLRSQAEVDALGQTGCTSVRGRLVIGRTSGSDDITSLESLVNLTSVEGSMDIYYNDVLTNLDGLDNLTSVEGHLYIGYNAVLTSLNGLANLTSVGALYLIDNSALTNLDGLARLTRIEDLLDIIGNPALANLNGLANLTSVEGGLNISSNPALTNLDGLTNLTSVESINIENNRALTNLDGLASLTSVNDARQVGAWRAGNMFIWLNRALINLDGLANLTSVGGALEIFGNYALTNVDGLANLTNVDDLAIYDNAALTNCQLVAPVLGWPDGPPEGAVDGDISIYSNAAGCNSIAEILEAYSDALPEIVALGLLNSIQGFLGSSSEDTAKETPPAAREAPAKDLEQAKPISTLPTLALFILSGLMALFGIRRLRAG